MDLDNLVSRSKKNKKKKRHRPTVESHAADPPEGIPNYSAYDDMNLGFLSPSISSAMDEFSEYCYLSKVQTAVICILFFFFQNIFLSQVI